MKTAVAEAGGGKGGEKAECSARAGVAGGEHDEDGDEGEDEEGGDEDNYNND